MKIACLILAHKNPKQLERLIRSLNHPSFHFFIHLDAKSSLPEFDYLRTIPGVYFVRHRVRVLWAGYSLVQATINGMEEIIGTGQYDYINLLSAQDFPLQPASAIVEFFRTHQGKEFITCWVDDGTNEWWKENSVRIKKYHLENWSIPGKYRLQFLLNRILPERTFPLGYTVAGRSQWFSITTTAAAYILQFLREHPELVRYFKYVWGCDEFIFSTVLYNSPFRKQISDNLMYTDWSERKPNPKILTLEDWDKLMTSGKLFARKFDAEKDGHILDKLEARLLNS